MDGLSAAASGIAVVSLAIQLVDSVRKIQRFLRSVSDAPKELRRLVDLLEQLELILQQIAMLVEKQQNARFGETDMSTIILRAIKTCESKLATLENLVEATKQASSGSNRAARTMGSLKLACKKKDVQGFEHQLHDAVNLLSLTMMANLTYVHSESMGQLLTQVSATNQTASTITQELVLIRTGLANDRGSDCNETGEDVKDGLQRHHQSQKPTLKKQSTTFQTYNSPFGKLVVRKISRSASFGSDAVQSSSRIYNVDESSWVFMPSFLSLCVDFRYLSACGNIQRCMRTYPVIQSNHPVWDMCREGSVQGIQTLLSERKVSPFSVNSRGETLLHCAAGRFSWKVCQLLFEVGLTGKELDEGGHPPYRPAEILVTHSRLGTQNFRRTYHLFAPRVDDVKPASFLSSPFCFWGFEPNPGMTVDIFNELVNEFVSKENINDFKRSPISVAAKMLWVSHRTDRDHNSWKQATRHLISIIADHHNYRTYDRCTLLTKFLNTVDCSFDSILMGTEFLSILSELKFDVVEYLQAESKRHFDPSKSLPMLRGHCNTGFRERYLVISEAPPFVRWEWYTDPEGSAFELLNEFKNFAFGRLFLGDEERSWPFFYSAYCQSIIYSESLGTHRVRDTSDLRIWNDRLQRRQHKKALKLAKAQGTLHRGPKIPGAWID